MKDFVPKGTGNSRFLKSSIGATTTWEQFRDLIRSGTAPIDLNGVNPLGVDEVGTALSKANLLKDATAALYGLGAEAVPDAVLAAIKPLVDSKQEKVVFGLFAGNGSANRTINLGFKPKAVILMQDNGQLCDFTRGYVNGGLFADGCPLRSKTIAVAQVESSGFSMVKSSSGALSWLNDSTYVYNYIAFK